MADRLDDDAAAQERSVNARDAIGSEWARMRAEGFRGTNAEVVGEREEAGHLLRIVSYEFDDGGTYALAAYVEVAESHDSAYGARILPLSAAVHILQNVTDTERWALENREAVVESRGQRPRAELLEQAGRRLLEGLFREDAPRRAAIEEFARVVGVDLADLWQVRNAAG